MKKSLVSIVLRLGLGLASLATIPSAYGQTYYLVNGHAATASEAQMLISNGFDHGAFRVDGWGIAMDLHSSFVPDPRPVLAPVCHYIFDVPLDCDDTVKIASR